VTRECKANEGHRRFRRVAKVGARIGRDRVLGPTATPFSSDISWREATRKPTIVAEEGTSSVVELGSLDCSIIKTHAENERIRGSQIGGPRNLVISFPSLRETKRNHFAASTIGSFGTFPFIFISYLGKTPN
jgi:hypothetical protein